MRFELKDFQTNAVAALSRRLRSAVRDHETDRERFALTLSAPTGSGKTVIATALVEGLFFGDQEHGPDENACVLWLTDDPHLNEQTRRKMLEASSLLRQSSLVTIDASFDQETLDPHRVYFLNIQKLGKDTQYTKTGDLRRHTLWDTIAATGRKFGAHFLVVIDEAHRGMATVRDSDRTTIASRFLTGTGQFPPVPGVIGISATPGRFNAKARDDRMFREIVVPVSDVRESGLLKEKIFIWHPNETQPGDVTLAGQAVREWRQFHDRWLEYSRAQGVAPVAPVLVVQIAPASKGKASLSRTDVSRVLQAIQREDSSLVGRALAHCLSETGGMPLVVDGQAIRYIEPEGIENDPHVRLVVFKDALTTGWDCPRAEVMLSFRSAQDDTYIAQLIGRMVRTPLARRVLDDDVLNTVSLFLPYFDGHAVDDVISHFRQDDVLPAVDVETKRVICQRNPVLPDEVFQILSAVPSYLVPRVTKTSQVARLNRLAHRLAVDGLFADAESVASVQLLDSLAMYRKRMEDDGRLASLMTNYSRLDIGVKAFDVLSGESIVMEDVDLPLDARNLDDLMKSAARRLRDGLVLKYWTSRYQQDGLDPYDAKLEAAALASDDEVVDGIESLAEQKVRSWLNEYDDAIRGLSDDKRSRYYELRAQARQPEEVHMLLGDEWAVSESEKCFPLHLYADADGQFPVKLTTWEERTLLSELATATTIAWFRNPPRGAHALTIPYEMDGTDEALHPDFVFFHDVDGTLRPSIVDPHRFDQSDAGPKLRGLASYAEKHGESLHRIDAVIVVDEELMRLDLKDPNVRAAVRNVGSPSAIVEVFRKHGAKY